jgi:outer membrane immunogenic protein
MMRRVLATLLVAAPASRALADELSPTLAPPRALPYWEQTTTMPKYFTWTGGYIGFQVGGAWQQLSETVNAPFLPPIAGVAGLPGYISPSYTSKGAIFGGHLGFNYQFAPNFVVGVEGDGEGSTGHDYVFSYGLGFGPYNFETFNNMRASIRGRLGYANGHWLAYATGGAAWANYLTTHSFVLSASPIAIASGAVVPPDSSNFTPVGWTVGAGVEYAFMGNLSARVEYRYADYGSTTIYSQAPGLTYADRSTEHTVRGGISYRFWAPPPPPVAGVNVKY